MLAVGAVFICRITKCSLGGGDPSQNKYHSQNESLKGLLSSDSLLSSYPLQKYNSVSFRSPLTTGSSLKS